MELILLFAAVVLLIANGVLTVMTHKSFEKDLKSIDQKIKGDLDNVYVHVHELSRRVSALKENRRKPGRPKKDPK